MRQATEKSDMHYRQKKIPCPGLDKATDTIQSHWEKQEEKQTLYDCLALVRACLSVCLTVGLEGSDIPLQAGRVKGLRGVGEQGLFLSPPPTIISSITTSGSRLSLNPCPLPTYCKAHGICYWWEWNSAKYSRAFLIMMRAFGASTLDTLAAKKPGGFC